ncbi:MAG: hypothetical protein ACOYJE_10470 [Bacteroidaceae bacterium]|jgi:hypothetical protein
MKHIIRKVLFLLLLLSTNRVASAYDFECGGLYYNILSEEDRTVEVTYYDYYTGFDAMKVIVPEEFIFEGETYKVTSIGEAHGGHSIAVYADNSKKATALRLIEEGRVNFVCPADYRTGKEIHMVVKRILDKIKADCEFRRLLDLHQSKARRKK